MNLSRRRFLRVFGAVAAVMPALPLLKSSEAPQVEPTVLPGDKFHPDSIPLVWPLFTFMGTVITTKYLRVAGWSVGQEMLQPPKVWISMPAGTLIQFEREFKRDRYYMKTWYYPVRGTEWFYFYLSDKQVMDCLGSKPKLVGTLEARALEAECVNRLRGKNRHG